MKAEILKLAGVKNEKEFYKKFPTEQSFMAKYGKQLSKLKKAQTGDYLPSTEQQVSSSILEGNDMFPPDYVPDKITDAGGIYFENQLRKIINERNPAIGFDKPKENKLAQATAMNLGSLIAAGQDFIDQSKYEKKLKQYSKIADLAGQAAKAKPIPAKKLAAAAKKPGKIGQRARLAETLRKMKK